MSRIRTNVGGLSEAGTLGSQVAALDHLLDGGILIPPDLRMPDEGGRGNVSRPLLVLIAGPPGSGKSTLALEICYRAKLARQGEVAPSHGKERWAAGDQSAFYASLESPSDRIIANAREGFGWDSEGTIFERFQDSERDPVEKCVVVLGNDRISEGVVRDNATTVSAATVLGQLKREANARCPGIVAIDGINILNDDQQEGLLAQICQKFLESKDGKLGPFLLIVVLDSPPKGNRRTRWEFMADLVISLDSNYERDYYLRTIEISKARYQSHALGRQRVKIRGAHGSRLAGPLMEAIDVRPKPQHEEGRYQGGLSIFPSVHRALSQFKRIADTKEDHQATGYMTTPYENLDGIIAPAARDRGERGGLPLGKCTAFLGGRGSLKSHIAYHIALRQAVEMHSVTIVSLRDDIFALEDTLKQIAKTEEIDASWKEKMRFVYFWPGYISPEQFYHTISGEILGQDKPDFVVIGGLDRIEGRFPLCSREPIFVPALVSLLNLSEITSLVTSAQSDTHRRSGDASVGPALLPMADLVLGFEAQPSSREDSASRDRQRVRIQALRVPRGEIGRGCAIARRLENGKLDIQPE